MSDLYSSLDGDHREPLTNRTPVFSSATSRTGPTTRGKQWRTVLTLVNTLVLVVLLALVVYLILRYTGAGTGTGGSGSGSGAEIDRIPNGHINVEGVPVYSAGTGDSVILLLPDVFGSKNTTWAVTDAYAQAGFTVLDLQYALTPWDGTPTVDKWKFNHPFEPILTRVTQVIDSMKARGYQSFQAQGYCYGGRVSLVLAQTTLVRSTVAAHPSDLIARDPLMIQRPVFLVVPQLDDKSFLDQVPYWNQTLRDRQMEYQIKVYEGAHHGFGTTALNASYIDGRQKLAAIADSIAWFKAHQ